ncbi:MAG: hypothetical protein ABI367_13280 [Mucilaginibacter sp.]
MKLITLLAMLLIISSCSTNENSDNAKNGTTVKPPIASALCFLLTEGNNNRDSTSIELVIKNNKVTGSMNWLPYQKDSRKGSLTGTINNNIIQANWSFMQEGIKDTLNLQFMLDSTRLLQKPLKANTQSGRQQTDALASYTLIYHTSDKIYN